MGTRRIVVASDYSDGDVVGPFHIATTEDTITDGHGNVIPSHSLRTVTADHTVLDSDYIILVNAASANIAITLPTAVDREGFIFIIKRIDTGAGGKSVTVSSAVNIDNNASIGLNPYVSINVVSDNSKWWII